MPHPLRALLLLSWTSASIHAFSSLRPIQPVRVTLPIQFPTIPAMFLQPKRTALHYSNDCNLENNSFRIFCDMDGVLVDFEHGVKSLFDNRRPNELPKETMWKGIAQADSFFEHLPWTRDGKELWSAIQHLSPKILTGVPQLRSSKTEKVNWCRRELLGLQTTTSCAMVRHVDMASPCGKHCICFHRCSLSAHDKTKDEHATHEQHLETVTDDVGVPVLNVITCWSTNKYHESGNGAVLIDDTEALRSDWEAAGGIFVHHQNTETTLRTLQEYGILGSSRPRLQETYF